MGIEDLQNPPPSGVINRAPLHRHEPGIKQMTQHLGDRLDLPGAIATKYQRTVTTSSLQTLGHRLQRKEAIGPADGELINGFGHRSSPPIPELSAQTPQIARQTDVVVPSPVQETTQRFRIRRSPQGVAGGQAIVGAMAGGPLNPPSLGDFESGSRAPQPLAEVAVPSPVQETTTQTFRIRRSPQGVTGGQSIVTTTAGPLNPPSLGDFEPSSAARSPQNWGLGGDTIATPQAETIVQRKVQTQVQTTAQPGVLPEVQTTTPTLVQTIAQSPTSLQQSPTPPLQLRQAQTDAINRYAIDSSKVLQQPTTAQSETGVIQRHVESSPLLLHSQAIVQRVPNDGYTTIPPDQRIAPPSGRSEDSAQSPDITGLVDHISRIMARQLAVERERRGL
jgi:hypothetical protein